MNTDPEVDFALRHADSGTKAGATTLATCRLVDASIATPLLLLQVIWVGVLALLVQRGIHLL